MPPRAAQDSTVYTRRFGRSGQRPCPLPLRHTTPNNHTKAPPPVRGPRCATPALRRRRRAPAQNGTPNPRSLIPVVAEKQMPNGRGSAHRIVQQNQPRGGPFLFQNHRPGPVPADLLVQIGPGWAITKWPTAAMSYPRCGCQACRLTPNPSHSMRLPGSYAPDSRYHDNRTLEILVRPPPASSQAPRRVDPREGTSGRSHAGGREAQEGEMTSAPTR
jgi:hypothetical protein